jgi:uncharacterized LabA/DUF88 family protein
MTVETRTPPSFSVGAKSPPITPTVAHEVPSVVSEMTRFIPDELRISEALPGLLKHEPTAVILDVNNLYKTAKFNDFNIDYGRLKTIFEQRCDLRYIGAFSATAQDNKSGEWVAYMNKRGYDVRTKPLKQYVMAGKNIVKGNMDVEITMAAMDLPPAFTHVIIGTCDGDFIPLIQRLKQNLSRHVSVIGTTNSYNTNIDRGLIKAADNFYDLTKIKEFIDYNTNKDSRGDPNG